jgi:hypothetical protein
MIVADSEAELVHQIRLGKSTEQARQHRIVFGVFPGVETGSTDATAILGVRGHFATYGAEARAVLDALLDKYADHGIADIEDPEVLELPPFDRLGNKTRIRRGIFGGAEKFSAALTELERQLYQETA